MNNFELPRKISMSQSVDIYSVLRKNNANNSLWLEAKQKGFRDYNLLLGITVIGLLCCYFSPITLWIKAIFFCNLIVGFIAILYLRNAIFDAYRFGIKIDAKIIAINRHNYKICYNIKNKEKIKFTRRFRTENFNSGDVIPLYYSPKYHFSVFQSI